MTSKILSLLGIAALSFKVACNNADDDATTTDSSSATTTETTTSSTDVSSSFQTTTDGRKYILRPRKASASVSTSGDASATVQYDTVWTWSGSEDRWYTLGGSTGRDTLYYNTDEWNAWWNDEKTDDQLKVKSGNTKVKVEKDGSWKVKDDTSKTKMTDDGEVKTKKKG